MPAAHPSSGQSVLELALSLPVFAVLLLGTVEMSHIVWVSLQVNNAARAGAQFGSQSRINAGDASHISTAAQDDAPGLTQLTVTSTQPCQCIDPGNGQPTGNPCTLAACPSPDIIMDFVQVNASASITPIFRLPFLPASYTLHGHATLGVLK